MLQYRLDIFRTILLSTEKVSTVFIDEIDTSFDFSINHVDPKTGEDVSCHDPDDVSPTQPITSTPKATEMGWRCQAII